MDSDGSNVKMLTHVRNAIIGFPSWSPDGKKLAFNTDQDGNFDIYTINSSDGSNPTQLTSEGATDFQPTWSPDGTKIAFTSDRVGGNQQIYVMNANGRGRPTKITADQGPYTDTNPNWGRRPR